MKISCGVTGSLLHSAHINAPAFTGFPLNSWIVGKQEVGSFLFARNPGITHAERIARLLWDTHSEGKVRVDLITALPDGLLLR